MIKKQLETKVGKLDERQFQVILDMATDDIRGNRIGHKKRTTYSQLLDKLITCYKVERRLNSRKITA